jgi:hypothetical protein
MGGMQRLMVKRDLREKRAFRDAAALAGVPLSTGVRARLWQVAVRELEAAARAIAFLNHLSGE